jgi:hypothetical protein
MGSGRIGTSMVTVRLRRRKKKKIVIVKRPVFKRDPEVVIDEYRTVLADPLEPLSKKRFCEKWLKDRGIDYPTYAEPILKKRIQ